MKSKKMLDSKLEKKFNPPPGYKFVTYGTRKNFLYRIGRKTFRDVCVQYHQVDSKEITTKFTDSLSKIQTLLGNLGHNVKE